MLFQLMMYLETVYIDILEKIVLRTVFQSRQIRKIANEKIYHICFTIIVFLAVLEHVRVPEPPNKKNIVKHIFSYLAVLEHEHVPEPPNKKYIVKHIFSYLAVLEHEHVPGPPNKKNIVRYIFLIWRSWNTKMFQNRQIRKIYVLFGGPGTRRCSRTAK